MIKVLIIDDSAIVRTLLSRELSKYQDIEIVGTAADPYVAREKIAKLNPDVLTLDLEMPRMDGLSFLAKLMKHYPMPVVVLSSLAPKNSENALKALELGAVEVLCKPGSSYSAIDVSRILVNAIRAAASARISRNRDKELPSAQIVKPVDLRLETTHKLIALGASTGGTRAIELILRHMPISTPGIVIVQHMPEHFTSAFAKRLNEVCDIEVREAADNDSVLPGKALIAPGNHHILVQRSGAVYLVKIKDGPPVHYQRPSVDVLFHSVAKHAGANAIGVLLTGMGADGAKGLLAMNQSGAHTIVQNEESCVVFGMPREAIKLGAADQVTPLSEIPAEIIKSLQNPKKSKKTDVS